MREHHSKIFKLITLALVLAVLGCDDHPKKKPAMIVGDYELVLLTQPHSQATVDMVIINNFACPHCAKFNASLPLLSKKYGSRLNIQFIDIITNERTREASKAHLIAQQKGNAAQVRSFLYDQLRKPRDQNDTNVLRQRFGIDVDSVTAAQVTMLESRSSLAYRIATETPTILINEQIKMQGDVEAIEAVIDQMLTHASPGSTDAGP